MNNKSYIFVVLGIVLAKVVGFSRDIFFASFYGTGITADIYFQVFGIVTLIFTGVGVALQTQVIMNLNKEENNTPEKKKAYVSAFLKKCIFYLLLVTAVLYLGAKPLTRMLLPNLTDTDFALALRLTYIMLPSFLFVAVAYIISGILQNSNVFFIPSIVSLPYNVVIIAALFLPDVTIEQIGMATTFGWFLHIAIQLPDFYRKGYRFVYRGSEKLPVKQGKADMSIWWIFISNLMFQLCFIIDKTFVSGNAGQTSAINYASNLFITISSVFVVAMSSVVFPAISKNYEEGNIDYVCRLIGNIISIMTAVFVPFLLVVTLFGDQLIALLYQRGEFDSQSTMDTATVFVLYSFGIFGYLAQELINRVMYLASKYRFTVAATVLTVVLKLVLDFVFVPTYGMVFAAASTTVLLDLYGMISFVVLRKTIGSILSPNVTKCLGKVLISGAAALAVYFVLLLLMPGIVTGNGPAFILPILICGAVYLGAAFLLGVHKQLLTTERKEGNEHETN